MKTLDAPIVTDLNRGFHLGEWEVQPLRNTVILEGHARHIEPKVMDVLLCLANSPGEVVSRDQLLSEVWEGLVVTEEVLTRCISELRTALGDTSRQRQYIRTIPKRGYSLIMPLQEIAVSNAEAVLEEDEIKEPISISSQELSAQDLSTGSDNKLDRLSSVSIFNRSVSLPSFAAVAIVALLSLVTVFYGSWSTEDAVLPRASQHNVTVNETGRAPINSASSLTVAVLPFVNISGDSSRDYFGNGLAEDIRNQLINTPGIQVAARTSSEVFRDRAIDVREIGRQLNVSTLVEGTVRQNGQQLRLTIQLTDASTGFPLWSERYEQTIDNLFEVQDQIAASIVAQLIPDLRQPLSTVKLSPADVRAYDSYLLGRHHWNQRTPESVRKAIGYFRQSIEIDRNYALAYSGLADALILNSNYDMDVDPDAAVTEAQDNVNKAMALNSELAEVHASQGLIFRINGESEKAREFYQRAIALNPRYSMAQMWLGNVLQDLNQITEAYPHYKAAITVDPLHPRIQNNFLRALSLLGNYEQVASYASHFYQQSLSESLLKIEMNSYLLSGQYGKVLEFAVRHNFSEHYKTYATQIVIEALIYLQRFDEVDMLIEQNRGYFKADQLSKIRVQQALAKREPDKIMLVAEQMQLSDNLCSRRKGYRYAGYAGFLKENYQRANDDFSRSLEPIEHYCKEDPVNQLNVYAHYAVSLRQANRNNDAEKIVTEGFSKLKTMLDGGYNGSNFVFGHAAMQIAAGDNQKAMDLLQELENRNWQPFGKINANPFFDDLQEQLFTNPDNVAGATHAYQNIQTQSKNISLTKFGI